MPIAKEFLEFVLTHGEDAIKLAEYILGKRDDKPAIWAKVPTQLQSEIELKRLELRSGNGDSDPGA